MEPREGGRAASKLTDMRATLGRMRATPSNVFGIFLMLAASIALIVGAASLWGWMRSNGVNVPSWVFAVVKAVTILGAWYWFWRFYIKPVQAESLRRYWLGLGACPSCGRQLGQPPSETDGCTICSECGAAWKMGLSNPK